MSKKKSALLCVLLFVFTFIFSPKQIFASSSYPKGVNWHFGAWYGAAGATGYNWDGLRHDLDTMKAAGIDWVRFSFSSGNQTSCYNGFYSTLAAELASRGMQGEALIGISDPTHTTATDDQIASYKNWLTSLVNCYKNNFHYFEVWNEPNLRYFWNIDERWPDGDPRYAVSVSYYVKYLKATSEVIKAIDPTMKILNGGLSQWKMERFMDELKNQGAGQYIDIVAYHPYSDTGADGVITALNNLKAKMAVDPLLQNKPIWINEIGFTTTSGAGPGYVTSEQIKADYLTQTYQRLAANGITQYPIIWYDWDNDSCCAGGYNLVLTDRTAAPFNTTLYPAYTAIKNVFNCGAPGDIDCSGVVNSLDLSMLISKFGQTVPAGTREDIDSSGKVNSLDLTILLANFGT